MSFLAIRDSSPPLARAVGGGGFSESMPFGERKMTVVVAEIRARAEGVRALVLEAPSGSFLAPWAPGAHIDLVLDDGLTRQYSLCGSPAAPFYEIAVRRDPESRGGSAHIHEQVNVGDQLQIRGPRNRFRLVEAERYVFIAGGIGVTPILPMLEAIEEKGVEWVMHYGGRSRRAMAYAGDLSLRYGDRVRLYPQDETGPLDLSCLLRDDPTGAAVYCCGPSGLLRAIEEYARNWPAQTLHVERFEASAAEGPSSSGQAFTVELARSGRSLRVTSSRSVLEVLHEAGIPVPFSCREGTCGTCETGVLSGTPDHRDEVLTPSERAEGSSMMVCVSRSHSPRLMLDC